jgi:hypothetical protein
MNTIILIILTLIFLVFIVCGIFLVRHSFYFGTSFGVWLFFIGMIGILYLGLTIAGDAIYTKETVCSYTVGKSDEVCMDNYTLNFDYIFSQNMNKITLSYFISDVILGIILIREFLLLLYHAGEMYAPEL